MDRNPANRQDGNEGGHVSFYSLDGKNKIAIANHCRDHHHTTCHHRPPKRNPHGSPIPTRATLNGIAVAHPSPRPCRRRRINHASTGAVTRPSPGHTPSETVNRRRSIGEFAFHHLHCRTTTASRETARTHSSAVAPTMFAVYHLLGAAFEMQHDASTWRMI